MIRSYTLSTHNIKIYTDIVIETLNSAASIATHSTYESFPTNKNWVDTWYDNNNGKNKNNSGNKSSDTESQKK